MFFPFKKKKNKAEIKYFPYLYPMGAVTFAIACSHCLNVGSELCSDCKSGIKSGFNLKTEYCER